MGRSCKSGRGCRSVALCAALCAGLLGQTPGPEFEVASVRFAGLRPVGVAPMGVVTGGPGTSDPTRIRYHDIPFVQLAEIAYGMNTAGGLINDGIVTPAQWMWDNYYEVVANIEPGATPEQVRIMLRKLLADRFALRVHRETRKFAGFEVVIAKDGLKLQTALNPDLPRLPIIRDAPPVKDRFPGMPEGYAGMAVRLQERRYYLVGAGQSISDLLSWSPFRHFHVVDKTGLTGKYDFQLTYGQDLYDAMEKQLGLKVRPADVSIDVLVIDSAKETPTAN
jgi:uncharacterized protein (TIGR03435 family)